MRSDSINNKCCQTRFNFSVFHVIPPYDLRNFVWRSACFARRVGKRPVQESCSDLVLDDAEICPIVSLLLVTANECQSAPLL